MEILDKCWRNKMDLYFTRHGKTEWNQKMIFQGMYGDSPLLPQSYQEIHRLGQTIKAVPFEKIYASTSSRAKITAEKINQELDQPVEIIYTDSLRELGLGILEGESIQEMRQIYGKELENMRYRLDLYDESVFKAEPILEAINRIQTLVDQAVNKASGPILFVGHGTSLTAAVQAMTGKKLSELRSMGGLKNNSLTIVSVNEQTKERPYDLKLWNEDSFLQEHDLDKNWNELQ